MAAITGSIAEAYGVKTKDYSIPKELCNKVLSLLQQPLLKQ